MKTDEEQRMEAKLRSRSAFWHLVKRVRELQIKVYQDKDSTKDEYYELKGLLIKLDSILDKAKLKLLTLGVIEEESRDSLAGMFGDELKNIQIAVYKAHDGYEKARSVYLSTEVIIMRQRQILYQATHKTCIYPILFSCQKSVDDYLAKGELHDQLEMMPKRNPNYEQQPIIQQWK